MAANNAIYSEKEIVRPLANFSPSLWGDRFSNLSFDGEDVYEMYAKEIEALKKEVLSLLTSPASEMVEVMNLIETLERLGVSYHFEEEIEKLLCQFFKHCTNYEDESYDLYTVALHFRLFRQHSHRISCDIFNKFKDGNGKFKSTLKSDVKGLLSLYEAVHLRIHGEDILEEALEFATSNLKLMVPHLSPVLKKQVEHSLKQCLHFGYPRLEARFYISIYEEQDEPRNESLLRFAKMDYVLLQLLHKKELCEVSRWWRDLNFVSVLPYARDRVVECYFWTVGVYCEPQYSLARIMLAKVIAMISVIDDTYDAYGTIGELKAFTDAIQRWNISEMSQLPVYMETIYKVLLDMYEQFEKELSKQGRSYAISYAVETLKELVGSYYVEAEWFAKGHIPSFPEYMNIAKITCTNRHLATVSLFGVKSATKEVFEWLMQNPKVLIAGLEICRYMDDVATYEVEKEREQMITGIECYMKEYNVAFEEARKKFDELAVSAWKDSNEACLDPNYPSREVVTRVLNFSRIVYITYKDDDGYTRPEKVLKPYIISLFIDSIKFN